MTPCNDQRVPVVLRRTSGDASPRQNLRRGISLIEVIACTAIVTVMVVPIASVIRASGQSIARSKTLSTDGTLRSGIRWIRDMIHDGQVVDVGSRNITLIQASGDKAEFVVSGNTLILTDGRTKTVLLENVESFETSLLKQSESPGRATGISIRLQGKSPSTGKAFDYRSMISLPNQA
ncbi:hypothetical protein K227x_17340 [Rubripirellula lacrimiformis]|uniref:Prepilin-type N-terminal cleavage/methylation domain-containing protein n=1 Tax=Rubripirellula lacrimiformis TaxID=1930273 RepID=A0A517N8A2_9BACT|nr:hypothetical protein [Rubripirellula lacrimiformis]QDT03352.1 hypothetical protein K227x_17340 [Rubripirellula lacrimiformis]